MDLPVLLALSVFAFLAIWTRRSRYLNGWDSALFALGLEEYDIESSRPHAPGYPIFVALGRVALVLLGEANAALVLVSALAAAASVGLLYGFVRELGSMRAATAAALLYASAPILVFNGSVALSYTCEAAASIGLAWLAWRTRRAPTARNFAWLGVTWSVAVGLRPSLLFFLSPLVLYAALAPPREAVVLRTRAVALAVPAAAATLLWFIPMIAATGGYGSWREATALQSGWVVFSESVFTEGWSAWNEHMARMKFFLRAERLLVPVALNVLVLGFLLGYLAGTRPLQAGWSWLRRAGRFFAVWLLPSLAFYLLVFNGWGLGPTGYILVLLPGVYALFALTVDGALRRMVQPLRRPAVRHAAGAVLLVVLLLPLPQLAQERDDLVAREVRAHDEWGDGWMKMKSAFPPTNSTILVWYSWTHVKWYFPEYTVWSYLPVTGRGGPDWVLTLETRDHRDDVPYYAAHYRGASLPAHPIPDWVENIVVFDFQLAGENGGTRRLKADVEVHEATPEGWRLLFFRPDDGRPHIEDYFEPLPDAFERDR